MPPCTSLSRSPHSLCPPLFLLLSHSPFILLTLHFAFGLGTHSPYIKPPLSAEYRVLCHHLPPYMYCDLSSSST
ncbi:hypothetical protein H4582DRAFT_1956772 [Lactarius indigo]|nr:hypothetical protein H4582DRAFT_1956772 [Lactarius indigo]